MQISEFCDSNWHDQGGNQSDLMEFDDRYKVYRNASIILDRMIGIDARQSIGPLIFSMKFLELIAKMNVQEIPDGLFVIKLDKQEMEYDKLRKIVNSKIQSALDEISFIERYSQSPINQSKQLN